MVTVRRVSVAGLVLAIGGALLGPGGAVAAPAGEGFGKDAWWYKAMGLAEAHKETTGKGVTLAVIDTPVDTSVPELRGQNVTPVRNFCGGRPVAKGSIAEHGTTVLTNIVGSGRGTNPGGIGVRGISPDSAVRLYAADTARKGVPCSGAGGALFARAIDAAISDGARLISISGGRSTADDLELAAVKRAIAAGVIVIAAAGNAPDDVAVIYPAAYPGVIAVAAVDRNAKPWKDNVKGNREAFVISAPGVEVTTAGFDGETWRSDAFVTGTSEAAPLVAGGLALVASKCPSATGNQLIQHLIRNPGGSREFGKDLEYGYGIMSVTKMLASDPSVHPDVNPLIAPTEGAALPGASSAGASPGSAGEPAADGSGEAAVSLAGPAAGGGSGGVSAGVLVGAGVALLVILGAGVVVLARRRPVIA